MQADLDLLVAKWAGYMPIGASGARAVACARLLHAQERYFADLDADGPIVDALVAVASSDWRRTLLCGLGHAFYKHPVHDLFAIQPASGPISPLSKLVLTKPAGEGITQSWKIELKPVTMHAQPLPVRLYTLPVPELWGHLHAPIAEYLFEEALNVIMHSLLAQALEEGFGEQCYCPADELEHGLLGAQRLAYEASGRLPNVVVVNHEHQISTNRAKIIGLPMFPADRMLLLYKSPSPLFGSVTWVPFMFGFMPDLAEDGKPKIDSESFETYPDGLLMSIRHHIEITEPKSIVTVALRTTQEPQEAPEGSDGE